MQNSDKKLQRFNLIARGNWNCTNEDRKRKQKKRGDRMTANERGTESASSFMESGIIRKTEQIR